MIWSLTPKRVPEDAREIDASLRDQAGGVWVAAESKIVAVAVVGPNENGPDVKLGSKRQSRYRLLDWEKPEEAKARPKPTSDSLSFTVNRSSICPRFPIWCWRKRSQDKPTPALVRRLRCSRRWCLWLPA